MRRIASIDIGTNTVLLLVAEAEPGQPPQALVERCEITRLGQGVDQTKVLAPEAIARTVEVLKAYGAIAREQGAEVVAVGTQALREVRNATVFLDPARRALGGEIEIISGSREAQLAYSAVTGAFPELAARCAVVDVGGGSTEITLADGGQVVSRQSTKLGSVRLHERFCKSDPPSESEWAALVAHVEETLAGALAQGVPAGTPLVGIAGTVTTLAAIEGGVHPYDGAKVHGTRLSRGQVDKWTERLRRMSVAERRKVRGLEPKRADVIDAGAAILRGVMARATAEEVVVSDRGVRWALVYERLGRPTVSPGG